MIKSIIRELRLKKIEPLIYSKEIQEAYSCGSICEGSLLNKNVIITGGNGGIGAAIAKRFLDEGCNVVITGRNEEKILGCQT